METVDFDIEYPGEALDQTEEWIRLVADEKSEKIRLHDYGRFFEIPGLYEEVVYRRLKCCSPVTICSLLKDRMLRSGTVPKDLRVLDFGAGNGMIGECFTQIIGCEKMVGLDIIPQAREAAFRDYPGIYDDYYVMDLSRPQEHHQAELKKWRFNTLTTVAALGYGDIPTLAFMNAFNLVEDQGWIAFNIKERFISNDDDTGYRKVLDYLTEDCIELQTTHRYCHRLSLAGDPLFYHAVIGKKLKNIPSPQRTAEALQSIPN
ncbi:MAG: methyltransferase domain-containing protein [SAR324 cluster bacterium]|nr:methyltransferase domain-containing protein [SAR324 cluster bacterium]